MNTVTHPEPRPVESRPEPMLWGSSSRLWQTVAEIVGGVAVALAVIAVMVR